jgi:hypothetical protein
VVEQRKVTVAKKGKLRTIIQKLTQLVREDFTWKDPKAAEKADMPVMGYVIGGMGTIGSAEPSSTWAWPLSVR